MALWLLKHQYPQYKYFLYKIIITKKLFTFYVFGKDLLTPKMETGWKLQVILMCVTISVWYGILGLSILKKLCCMKFRNLNTTVSIPIRNIVIIHCISMSISFGVASHGVIHHKWNTIIWKIFYILHAIFLTISVFTYYLLTILRLKTAFQTSMYGISKIVIGSHYIILMIIPIIMSVAFFMFYHELYLMYMVIMCIVAIIIAISVSHVTYLFNHKLFYLVLSQRQSIYNRQITHSFSIRSSTNSCNNNKPRNSFNIQQLAMINIITKHTLLQTSSLLILILTTAISAIVIITIDDIMWGFVFYLWSIGFALICVSFSIYLSFGVNHSFYQLICSRFHNLMEKCCIELAEKKLIEKSNLPTIVPNTPSQTGTSPQTSPEPIPMPSTNLQPPSPTVLV